MHSYIASLIDSELPLAPWLVGVAWLLLLAGAYIVGRQSRLVLHTQEHVVVEESAFLPRSISPRFVVTQIIFPVVLFSLSYSLGEPVFTLTAGGFVAELAMVFGLNLHSLAFARRLHNDGTVAGKVTLSAAFVLADIGRRAMAGAVVFLITGLVFAQLAFLSGAFILASIGIGYVRRSHQQRAQP